ncbi:MAG: hypothetical protein DRQ39_11445, partial [Gammaproteobacteria bacterium]
PGKRLVGSNTAGAHIVVPTDDIESVIGSFDSEAEAKACSQSPEHIEQLLSISRSLMRELEEARQGFRDIADKVDPAHKDFESQRPVDMRGVIAISRKWCHYMLEEEHTT